MNRRSNRHPYRTAARRLVDLLPVALAAWCGAGCAPEAHFTLNTVYLVKQERESKESLETRKSEFADILTAMFGTPDRPQVPALGNLNVRSVMDIHKLEMSAGPVHSDETGRSYGLYREHCAHCHGITGDGAGPTAAFLNPYPRDYRLGIFKFKSTPKGQRPTHEDLRRILMEGIPGTAMPSFKILPDNEIESLIHYVRYLSVRGELERRLMNYAVTELDKDKKFVNLGNEAEVATDVNQLRSLAEEIVQKWIDAEGLAAEVPAPAHNLDPPQAIARGKELFYGKIANCVQCHGDSALGDGQASDYDDWTKELEPANAGALEAYLDAGAMHPRNILPRNLRLGVYRGGRRPIDLYWRLRNGIDGTPMPAVPMQPADKGLTSDDVWCLIAYVRSLPYESISLPAMPETHWQRERP
jgi:mono/diheme cytochrome c family protein